ncbi:MAG: uracil-DNA glycosylase [Nitrosomonadales bacterium]|nr:uracil-DNA glycosylase [Nitrosomonadales bacterium]
MNLNEAALRELNLYPLWVPREASLAQVEVALSAPTPIEIAPRVESVALSLPPQPSAVPESVSAHANLGWDELQGLVRDCRACKLRAGCTQTVFGVGDPQADWLFVGEGPGVEEDVRGEPFVGQAGRLLDNMLAALKLKRGDDVYIGNVVKCRPPGNRTPEADEIGCCLPYLQRQIELIQPKLIVALGKTAATALLGREASLASLRGSLHDYRGTPLLITYHPAYLLRSPTEKAKAWQDLCLARDAMKARKG